MKKLLRRNKREQQVVPATDQSLHQGQGNAGGPISLPGQQQQVTQPAQQAPLVIVHPGTGNNNQSFTVKIYQSIMGFSKKDSESKGGIGDKSCCNYVRSNWLLLLILSVILVLAVAILAVLIGVVMYIYYNGERPTLNDFELFGKLIGGGVRGFLKIFLPID